MAQDLGEIRKQKGMSISQLASKSGVSIAKLVEYDKGTKEIPSTDLVRLATLLERTLDLTSPDHEINAERFDSVALILDYVESKLGG